MFWMSFFPIWMKVYLTGRVRPRPRKSEGPEGWGPEILGGPTEGRSDGGAVRRRGGPTEGRSDGGAVRRRGGPTEGRSDGGAVQR